MSGAKFDPRQNVMVFPNGDKIIIPVGYTPQDMNYGSTAYDAWAVGQPNPQPVWGDLDEQHHRVWCDVGRAVRMRFAAVLTENGCLI